MTTLNIDDVWADLRVALDWISRDTRNIYKDLTNAARAAPVKSEDEAMTRIYESAMLSGAYRRAEARLQVITAHHAIEKGLKAILLSSGLAEKHIRSRRHDLFLLLEDVKTRDATAFNSLERCFDNATQCLRRIWGPRAPQHYEDMNILDHFEENGREDTFVTGRYASLEGGDNFSLVVYLLLHQEMILALSLIVLGIPPKDIDSRIENEASNAVTSAWIRRWTMTRGREPEWDVGEWLKQDLVYPRLESIQELVNDKVLRAAVRECAKETGDPFVQLWASQLRRKQVSARKAARNVQQSG